MSRADGPLPPFAPSLSRGNGGRGSSRDRPGRESASLLERRPNLVLCGFMASGKSTVGARLASLSGMPLVDTDAWIEERQGRTISEIFDRLGEPYFRSVERTAVAEVSRRRGQVIATGGGVPMDPDNLQRLSSSGVLFYLAVDSRALLDRLAGDGSRPLAAGLHSHDALLGKLEERRPHYESIPNRVDCSGRSVDSIAAEILERYEMMSDER